jgi:hypothetical protein
MKTFILKIFFILSPVLLSNLIYGIVRDINGDKTIPFRKNWNKQFMNHGQRLGNFGFSTSYSQPFDLSKERVNLTLTKYVDSFGFQNVNSIKNPKVLFIGDSFFDDPFLSYDHGLSFTFNESLNISSAGCSGFKVFNELNSIGYFKSMPRFIFIEIVERDLYEWSHLWEQIEHKEFKTSPYNNCGFDLVFGNNFKGTSFASLGFRTNTLSKKNGTIKRLDLNRDIYFYKDKIFEYNNDGLKQVFSSMKNVSNYFSKLGCRLVFVVAPDKESIFPEFYPKSNLPKIHSRFDSLGIQYINMYSVLINAPKRTDCYFDGDTHWNNYAFDLLINEMKKKMK